MLVSHKRILPNGAEGHGVEPNIPVFSPKNVGGAWDHAGETELNTYIMADSKIRSLVLRRFTFLPDHDRHDCAPTVAVFRQVLAVAAAQLGRRFRAAGDR